MKQLEQFVACIFDPNDIVEIRRIPSKRSTWHKASTLVEHIDNLISDNNRGENIYAGANPRLKRGGTKAEDVALARCLFADFDGITLDEANERIFVAGLPTPTLLLESGHGVHAYWLLVEPMADLAAWTEAQKRLIEALDSDRAIHDAPRIMRLPGFLNVKREPRVPCQIIDADPQRRYSLDTLLAVLPGLEVSKPTSTCSKSQGETSEIIEGRRKLTLVRLAGTMRRVGLTEQEMLAALRRINADRCNPSLDDAEVQDVARSIAKYPPSAPATYDAAHHTLSEPFPLDVLPDPIGPYVHEASEAIGCDPSFVALPLLASLASAIGNTRRVHLKPGWTEPSILWTAIVADSGQHKSPALDKATAALREKQNASLLEHETEMETFRAAMADYEDEIQSWKKTKPEGRKGERPVKPEEPIAKRYFVSDTTIEALASVLRHAPRGLLVVRDELAGWLNSFDAYRSGKGGDIAHWLSFHTGQPLTIDRKTGDKIIHVPRASVSLAGGIQPGTLRRALGQEHFENGLAARLLLACPPRRPRIWTDAAVSSEVRRRVTELFTNLLALDFNIDDGDKAIPVDLPLSSAARNAFISFYDRHGAEMATLSGNEASFWSKLEGAAARLALVLQMVRNPAANEVDEQSILAGIRLADWFGTEGRRVYRLLRSADGNTDLSSELQELLDWIRQRDRNVTARDVTRGLKRYRNDLDAAERDLSRLVSDEYGTWDNQPSGDKGGRPTRQFRLTIVGDGDESLGKPEDSGACVAIPATEQVATVESTMGIAV